MLRIIPIKDAKQAASYYSKSDGGYYANPDDLRREWGGKAATLLGLHGNPDYEHFKRLIGGYDPHTGQQLTAQLIENRIPGWDVNVHCPKGVTVALERGDNRIHDALWDAAREAMGDIEAMATTRVRKDGQQDDRVTGNLVWYGVEHPETRPAKDDQMPDPHRHIHFVVMNLTHDDVEGEWKAVKMRPVIDLRKYLDRRFNMRFASKLADLGYDVETKWRTDDRGRRKYVGWDVKGIPDTVLKKFSRRSGEVDKLAGELGVTLALGKDKLGATSRLHKRDDLTLDDYRRYWDSRVTPGEARQVAETIKQAVVRNGRTTESTLAPAMRYAVDHEFYHHSVVEWEQLAVTAMERSMGTALPDQVEPEAKRQGVLFNKGLVTTQDVLAEERRMIAFAVAGKGTMRPLGPARLAASEADLLKRSNAAALPDGPARTKPATLSTEQQAVISHLLTSTDRVMVVRGAAGTGKTTLTKEAVAQVQAHGKPVVMTAPTTAAVEVLEKDGFQAFTVARLLVDKQLQERARNGWIWADESGLIGSRTMARLFELADQLDARVVVGGDKRQLASVERGSPLRVLEDIAGLKVAEVSEIRRQSGAYKDAVKLLAKGKAVEGLEKLDAMGCVKTLPVWNEYAPVAKDYVEHVKRGESALIVCPTHAEGAKINHAVRAQLKQEGVLGDDERDFQRLVPTQWTEAERGDASRYSGNEVVQFHRNSGAFKAGSRAGRTDLDVKGRGVSPAHFAVFSRGSIELAPGDSIRITGNGRTIDEQHRLTNGATYGVKGFTREGDIALSNGWVIDKSFGHLTHNYVNTAYAAQGRTVDHAIVVQSSMSAPASSKEAFYVAASRGRKSLKVWTDSKADLREAVERSNPRMSATELIGPEKQRPKLWHRVRQRVRQAIEATTARMNEMIQPDRGLSYAK